MLDLHAHILPGIDDGPRTLEDAVALVKALHNDGVVHVVATPHIYPGVFDNTPSRIAEAFDLLRSAMLAQGVGMTMTWAAEVRICPEILDWLEKKRLPLLNGSLVGPSTALIELPDGQIPVGTERLMGQLIDQGITPLIAHPERNKAVMEQPSRLDSLRSMGCLFQVTAGSVLGEFGRRAQATAQRLLDTERVDVIASDTHNLSGRRPRMQAAYDWLVEHYSVALAEQLMVSTPTSIAGVQSFTVQAGDQSLVFQDLPIPEAEPWAANEAWLQQVSPFLDTVPAQTDPVDIKSGLSDWSLQDFRLDNRLDDWSPASGATGAAGHLFSQNPPPADLGLRSATAPAAMASPAEREEDWQLPFLSPVSPAAPRPVHTAPPRASAPMPAQAHQVSKTAPDSPAAVPVQAPAPAAVPEEPSAAALLMAMARKLQSQRPKSARVSVHAEVNAVPSPTAALPVPPTPSVSEPPPEPMPRPEAPVLTQVVRPAMKPLLPTPRHAVVAPLSAPAPAVVSVETVEAFAVPHPTEPSVSATATASAPPAAMPAVRKLAPQGLRLNDLAPRDLPPTAMTPTTSPALANLKMRSMQAMARPERRPATPLSVPTTPRQLVTPPLNQGMRPIVRETATGEGVALDLAAIKPSIPAQVAGQALVRTAAPGQPQGFRLCDIQTKDL